MMENFNPFSLQNKVVLITGASSGIGKSIAIECSKMGATLIITGRDGERLNNTFSQLSGEGHRQYLVDLTNEEDVDLFVKELPALNGLVNCAGIIKRLPLKFIKNQTFEDLMNVNFLSQASLIQKIYKKNLLAKESSIVLISSVATNIASLGNIMYMASKGAMNSFMKGIAFELSSSNIRANAIQPGMIKTNLTTAIPDDEIAKDVLRYPLGRYGNPEEVAYAAIYLLSDATKWMTGSVLTIDGGLTLR
ncbi:MAG: SDR family NAD(P)-dependent oxidoreductase [Bacteroidales bacterium]|nr:SDR family NAD(P)-dependent oxidoreductase [Bacteroidales bacterium]